MLSIAFPPTLRLVIKIIHFRESEIYKTTPLLFSPGKTKEPRPRSFQMFSGHKGHEVKEVRIQPSPTRMSGYELRSPQIKKE